MELLIIYFIGAISLSFLCSVLEAVLLSTPMSFISLQESKGARSAKLLKKFKLDIDKPIAAILSLNTIAHTIGAAGVGAEAVKIWGEAYFGLISAILTALILVLSEIIPKIVGATYWRSLALPTSRIIQVLIIITYPLVLLSELITKLISHKKHPQSVSREEVSAMVTVGAEEGVFEKEENKMIQNLIKLKNVSARDIMTPSVVVAAADETMTLREFYKNEQYKSFSRIPVYSDNKDYPSGYVLRQSILERLAGDKFDMHLSEIKRPILSFAENTEVSDIWEELVSKKEHISAIIDEYGCMRGIVTMEDVIETMLGFEIVDEKDTIPDMQVFAREKWQKKKQDKNIIVHDTDDLDTDSAGDDNN